MRKYIFYLILILLVNSGCAARSKSTLPSGKGIYHRVEKGQTLWRISKTYDVDVTTLIEINKLKNPSVISAGQRLFIPGATARRIVSESVSTPSRQGFIWPVEGKVVSFYGMKSNGVVSKGINILAEEGALIRSVKNGKVSFVNEKVKGKGKVVIIDHLDGFLTLYAHNSMLLVAPGEVVKQGQAIARVGKTGRVDSSQLYFEIRKGHSAQNPFYYLP
jgi:murein DD-endopeptidase MepM/ murein hydrolase activator NlpD